MKQDQKIPNALMKVASNLFRGALKGEVSYGWHQKSGGQMLVLPDNSHHWLKVVSFEEKEEASKYITRIKEANEIKGVEKIILEQYHVWQSTEQLNKEIFYVALLMAYVSDPVCSKTEELRFALNLPDNWLRTLERQLTNLSIQKTDYVGYRQDLINRRIRERFGENICTDIQEWATIHSDLHWANLTQKEVYLLDWEGWGIGPRYLDICLLYSFSLLQPNIAEKIKVYFSRQMETKDSKICLLFACSELMRMYELYGDYEDLYLQLKLLSHKLIKHGK